MKICSRYVHLHFDGLYLGCNWIKVKIPLFMFDIFENDTVIINYKKNPWHKLNKLIVRAYRCIKTGKIISACCESE